MAQFTFLNSFVKSFRISTYLSCMNNYLESVERAFSANADNDIARKQASYMRDQFSFFGLKSPVRRELARPFLAKANLPSKEELDTIVKTLWQKPERELQYFAMELCAKYLRKAEHADIELFEFMVVTKSWWDTVDFIASTLIGNYFKNFPNEIAPKVDDWLVSGDIWLQRSAILFQLKYKDQTNEELLAEVIRTMLGSQEFFINKAIGWALREYSKFNPEWVANFADKAKLSGLSRREALRLIK